jgi:hypothetical protein
MKKAGKCPKAVSWPLQLTQPELALAPLLLSPKSQKEDGQHSGTPSHGQQKKVSLLPADSEERIAPRILAGMGSPDTR